MIISTRTSYAYPTHMTPTLHTFGACNGPVLPAGIPVVDRIFLFLFIYCTSWEIPITRSTRFGCANMTIPPGLQFFS